MPSPLFAQSSDPTAELLANGPLLVITLFLAVLMIIGLWKVFTKAGRPGWAAIIPIYNNYVLTQIAGKPVWWFVLTLVPYVNIVVLIMLGIEVAKRFGKSALFGGLVCGFLGVGYLIIGFDKSEYTPPEEDAPTIEEPPYPTAQ